MAGARVRGISISNRAWTKRLDDPRAIRLDGALGTLLEGDGPALDTPLWSARAVLEDPESVSAIHRAYAEVGVEVHTANTFRTRRRALARARAGEENPSAVARRLTLRAVALARAVCETATAPRFVFGSLGPVEDCYRPERAPDDDTLEREHLEHARFLAEAGCDGILVETHNNVREGRIATRAAASTGLPVWSSFVCGANARLLSGEPLETALEVATAAGADALGVNCIALSHCDAALETLIASQHPFGFAPNLSFDPSRLQAPAIAAGARAVARFTATLRCWRDAGARYVGACCGSRPEHLSDLDL